MPRPTDTTAQANHAAGVVRTGPGSAARLGRLVAWPKAAVRRRERTPRCAFKAFDLHPSTPGPRFKWLRGTESLAFRHRIPHAGLSGLSCFFAIHDEKPSSPTKRRSRTQRPPPQAAASCPADITADRYRGDNGPGPCGQAQNPPRKDAHTPLPPTSPEARHGRTIPQRRRAPAARSGDAAPSGLTSNRPRAGAYSSGLIRRRRRPLPVPAANSSIVRAHSIRLACEKRPAGHGGPASSPGRA